MGFPIVRQVCITQGLLLPSLLVSEKEFLHWLENSSKSPTPLKMEN